MLPYLIALDDVIDLPQVVAATCFVADLQQHQAYFLLSQFSCSDSTLLSSLKHTEREKEMGESTKIEKKKTTQSGAKRKERKREDGGDSLYLKTTSGCRIYSPVWREIWAEI